LITINGLIRDGKGRRGLQRKDWRESGYTSPSAEFPLSGVRGA
jgi:hypothetical protein